LRSAREHQVYIPKDVDYFALEVTTLAPADAAERILAEVRQRFASNHRVEWDVP
jgi:hypothetical protein